MERRSHTPRIYVGAAARRSPAADAGLAKAAEAVAARLAVPEGVEFARFEHAGRAYALSADVSVRVEPLDARVPDVVIGAGRARREAAKARVKARTTPRR